VHFCHSLPLNEHIHRGLYGALIVDPDPERVREQPREYVTYQGPIDDAFRADLVERAKLRNHAFRADEVDEMVMVMNGFDTNFDGDNEVYAVNTQAFCYGASALLGVQAVAAWGSSERSGLRLAYMIALGIGLHNLAEGLAIGSAVALGRASLGAFLVIGFMIHNVTEGPAIIAPVAGEDRPHLAHFAGLGLLAGAPIVLGGWIGGFAVAPTLGAVFLAIGVGAIVQVDYEILQMVRRDGDLVMTLNALGLLAGLGVMYVTDLLVAL